MQWDTTAHANFTSGTPWLPVNNNYKEINVASEEKNPNSVLNHFRKMTKLRKENTVLVYGDYELLLPEHEQVYAYTRTSDKQKILVVLNFSVEESVISLSGLDASAPVLINNYPEVEMEGNEVMLQPYQGVVFSLKNSIP
jgi:oligo-1,6-glucosidase